MYFNLISQYKSELENFILRPEQDFSRATKLNLNHTLGHCIAMVLNRNQEGYEAISQSYFHQLSQHIQEAWPLPLPLPLRLRVGHLFAKQGKNFHGGI